jgi:hypothetical protein
MTPSKAYITALALHSFRLPGTGMVGREDAAGAQHAPRVAPAVPSPAQQQHRAQTQPTGLLGSAVS